MDAIAAVLFEPVGCLAEFPPEPFIAALRALQPDRAEVSAVASEPYWQLARLLEQEPARSERIVSYELAAVEQADLYEDVRPALAGLRELGVTPILASSLSGAALRRFVEKFSLADLFAATISRDDAGGTMARPLGHAAARFGLEPARVVNLVDGAEALDLSKALGLKAMLVINDYDQGRALAQQQPAGGIVSLSELCDALKVIEQRAGFAPSPRLPGAPFELFEPT